MHRIRGSFIDRRTVLAAGLALGTASAFAPAQQPAGPIRLSGNENPYGPSPRARAAISGAIDQSCRYGIDAYGALLEAIAAHEGVPRSQVVLGAGSGELLHMLALSFAERGEIVCAWPTFSQLMSFGEKVGAGVVKVPLDARHAHDLDALSAAVTARTSLLYVCNPNNPTGTVIAPAALTAFCEQIAARTLVVADEAYIDLAPAGATASMLPLVKTGASVVVLRTFSKTHGLAGLRIGYALAPTEIAARLRRMQMTFPNALGVHAAMASLGDSAFLETTRRRIAEDRAALCRTCDALGMSYAEPNGNFVFVHVGRPVAEFQAAMRAEGIEVGRAFDGYPDWCRITIGTTDENDAVMATMRRLRAA